MNGKRLSLWASTYDCAVVLIGHLNKNEGSKGLYRSLGSIDVVAAARSVLQVDRDPLDSSIRIVRQIKNSLAPSDREIRFEIRPETGFKWLTINNKVTEDTPVKEPAEIEFSKKKDKTAYLIKTTLLQGDKTAKEMYVILEKEGISHRTAEDVRKEMGINCYRKGKQWFWSIHQTQDGRSDVNGFTE